MHSGLCTLTSALCPGRSEYGLAFEPNTPVEEKGNDEKNSFFVTAIKNALQKDQTEKESVDAFLKRVQRSEHD